MTLNCCPDAPLEPPAPTQEQERVNRIIQSIESGEKQIFGMKEELFEIGNLFKDIEKQSYLPFNLHDKVEQAAAQITGYYESEISRLEESNSDQKSYLIELGYAP